MKKFLLGVLVGVLAAGLIAVIAVGVFATIAAKAGSSTAKVNDNSTLVMKLSGSVGELAPLDFDLPIPGFPQNQGAGLLDMQRSLHKAATDNRVKALILMPRRPALGWAKLKDLQAAIADFKKSGKPIYAHLSFPGTVDYLIAANADKIFVTHDDVLDIKGMRVESTFFRGTFEKIGAEAEVETAGKYKDAGTPFTRKDLSPESREVLDALLDAFYGTMTDTIAKTRHKTVEQVKADIDNGPWTASQALKLGYVDGVIYEDEMEAQLAKKLGQNELNKTSFGTYQKASLRPVSGKHVALLVAEGEITRGEGGDFSDGIHSQSMIRQIRKVRDDDDVAAVVYRIDSPGGDAVASEEILREVKLLSQKKPTIISFSDVAASGGYYIASTGDAIVAQPNTITGSIGVIFMKMNLRGVYDKLGITKDIVSRGKMAVYDSDYVGFSDGAHAKLRDMIDEIYGNFLQRVATARGKKPEDIKPLAEGRVWTGQQAKDRGLVDALGGIEEAAQMARTKAKLPADAPVVAYPLRKSFLEQLLRSSREDMSAEAKIKAAVKEAIGVEIPAGQATGFLYRMPYNLTVR